MTLLLISLLTFGAIAALLYIGSYGAVLLFEHLQRQHRRRKALVPLTRRLHEMLADAGRPPIVRNSGGRHRMVRPRKRRPGQPGYRPRYQPRYGVNR
jgi:hypothetical protein